MIAVPDPGHGSRKPTRKQNADEETLLPEASTRPSRVGPTINHYWQSSMQQVPSLQGYDPVRAGATGSKPAFPSAIAYSCQEPCRVACATLYLAYTEDPDAVGRQATTLQERQQHY